MYTKDRILISSITAAVAGSHQTPVGIELFGKNHRQAGLHALAEFQPVDRHGDFAVGRDLYECRRLLIRLEWYCGVAVGLLRQGKMRKSAQGQTADADNLEETAAGKGGRAVSLIALKHVL